MKKIKIFFAIFVSLLLAFPPSALAEAIATITYIEGRADRLQQDGERYLPVVIGEEISVGDKIRTKSYSKAEITFADNSVVRLGDSSQIKVKEYEVDGEGRRKKGTIDLDRGRIRTIVSKTKDKTAFNVNTPNASGSVKGSDIFISYQRSTTGVLVADGIFSTLNPEFPDLTIEIPKGKTSVVPYNAPPKEPRIYLPIEKDRFESETGPAIRRLEKDIREAESILTTIVRTTGDVRIYPRGKKAWHGALINEVLNVGDIIETKEDGRIQIALDNGHIIELRPNTYFIIRSLFRDLKTGDYENLFECKYGKVRAKLQKISGNSSFKVKTPTAVCGVLGTIMYLEVLANLTKAFFEGGDGFITNLFSGITQTIQAGMTSSADGQGNVSDSTDTTDDERSEFGSEWGSEGSDDDTYGYSKPEGDPGDDYFGAGLDTGAGDDTGEPEMPGEMPFDIPQEPEPSTPTSPGPVPGGGEEPADLPINFSGRWGSLNGPASSYPGTLYNLYYDYTFLPGGEEGGTIEATDHSPIVSASGGYYYYVCNTEPFIWLTQIDSYNDLGRKGSYATPDGGAFYGFTGGSWANDTMDGFMTTLYIDSSGNVGYINGNVSGEYYLEDYLINSGTWDAEAILTATQMNHRPKIKPEDFEGYIEHAIVSGVGLADDFTMWAFMPGNGFNPGGALNIEGENWGVWGSMLLGFFQSDTIVPSSWDNIPLVGVVLDDNYEYNACWLGAINGTEWIPGGPIKGRFNGIWLEHNNNSNSFALRTITGNVVGDNEYMSQGEEFFVDWQASVIAEWAEINELVDLTDLSALTDVLHDAELVSLPITEVYSLTELSGIGSFDGDGTLAASMDINLYGVSETPIYGIWAIDIYDGIYSGSVDDNWTLDFIDNGDTIHLEGYEWSGDKWFADVEGTVDGNNIGGTASGTYDSVAFSGKGTGYWGVELVEDQDKQI